MAEGDRVVIVGAGQAGFQVAASLRDLGHGGSVTLVGEEPIAPYQRPPLSKAYLAGKMDRDGLKLRSDAFYEEHRITFLPGRRVDSIDRAARQVRLADGERLAYDHLVLATGARNRPLPVRGTDLAGVHQLRTVAEADALSRGLDAAGRVVIVGAGFIGLEFAAVAAARGVSVTVVEAMARPMARALSAEMSELFRAAHAGWGVAFRFGAGVVRMIGESSRVTAVEAADGTTIPADLVLVGIGVIPNADLAAEAGLAVADGILVDEHLATDDPAISAIGDCVRFPSRHAPGGPVRIESVQNAVDQARSVAARLVGRPAPYASVPWFWSDQGPLKLQIAGLAAPHDTAILKGDVEAGATVFCFRGGLLVGVETVNRPGDHMAARKLLAGEPRLTPQDVQVEGFDFRAYAKGLT